MNNYYFCEDYIYIFGEETSYGLTHHLAKQFQLMLENDF